MKPKIVAVIPARGGSKGIPRKNLANLGGKPLIAYSILSALQCEGIDRVIVSTDDEEIAVTAMKWGAEVPFLRPGALAGDKSSVGAAVEYTISQLGSYCPDVVITLMPTHPFRPAQLLSQLVNQTTSGYGQVMTVTEIPVHANSHVILAGSCSMDSIWAPFFAHGGDKVRSLHRFNGIFFAYIPTKNQSYRYVKVIKDPISLIDIDTPEDLYLANEVINTGLASSPCRSCA